LYIVNAKNIIEKDATAISLLEFKLGNFRDS